MGCIDSVMFSNLVLNASTTASMIWDTNIYRGGKAWKILSCVVMSYNIKFQVY